MQITEDTTIYLIPHAQANVVRTPGPFGVKDITGADGRSPKAIPAEWVKHPGTRGVRHTTADASNGSLLQHSVSVYLEGVDVERHGALLHRPCIVCVELDAAITMVYGLRGGLRWHSDTQSFTSDTEEEPCRMHTSDAKAWPR